MKQSEREGAMRRVERLRLAVYMFWRHGFGLRWTPQTAWYIAGNMMEMRDFCREHGIVQYGPWLIGKMR